MERPLFIELQGELNNVVISIDLLGSFMPSNIHTGTDVMFKDGGTPIKDKRSFPEFKEHLKSIGLL